MVRQANRRWRNTRCPDSKGIKTALQSLPARCPGNTRCPDSKGIKTVKMLFHRVNAEIPDALIQKGLRRAGAATGAGAARNTRCPDSKGIKTGPRSGQAACPGNTRCPDSKGIKTASASVVRSAIEIPDALIQKGLRPAAHVVTPVFAKYQMP